MLAAAASLRALAGSIPIVFTRRALHEGGEPIAVDEATVVELYAALCASVAVGQRVSAPGQIPIEALRAAMAALGEGL